MTPTMEYRLHKLTGSVSEGQQGLPAGGCASGGQDAVFYRELRMRVPEGTAVLSNVFVPASLDPLLRAGERCELYVVEAEAKVCSPGHVGCAVDGPLCHVFAVESGQRCGAAVSQAVGYFGALKRLGVDMQLSWAGLSLLVSFIVIGIPFLIYFAIQTVLALNVGVPSAAELRAFLGRHGFPEGCAAASA
jgi:hypothetical protein